MDCSGSETTLLSCNHNDDIGVETCVHSEDQAVECTGTGMLAKACGISIHMPLCPFLPLFFFGSVCLLIA